MVGNNNNVEPAAPPPPLQESETLKADASASTAVHIPAVYVPKFLKAMLDSNSAEHVEIPVEPNGTLLLSTLKSQFSTAIGLKYRNEETHILRAVRVSGDGVLSAPDGGWGDRLYLVVSTTTESSSRSTTDDSFKRKADEGMSDNPMKRKPPQCFKCGGDGHIAEMCPSPDGSRNMPGGAECHMCHGKGHIKVRCPNAIPPGVCYKCNVYGHTGRDCPGTGGYVDGGSYGYGGPPGGRPPMGGSSRPFDTRACFKCHQVGHQAMNCPQASGTSATACYKCGLEGHQARNCDICYRCKQPGHLAVKCPNP